MISKPPIKRPPGSATKGRLGLSVAGTSSLPAVLHLARSVAIESYGVGAIARALVTQQTTEGAASACWSVDAAEQLERVARNDGISADRLSGYRCSGPRRFAYSPELLKAVSDTRSELFQIAHQHSLWSAASLATCRWRAMHQRPTVISPHGALEPWSLRRSVIRKKLARLAFEDRNLREASCLHATGTQEIASFRQFGLKNPIAYIPNGVADSWIDSAGDASAFRSEQGIEDGRRVLLFLSRVTPKKGLPMLLEAISSLRGSHENWVLIVAGPDEFGHTQELIKLATDLGVSRQIQFVGPLYGKERRNAFAAAELFVLPTYSEGNPMAVLEALAVGVPVFTTKGCPSPFVEHLGAGWRTEVSSEGIASQLSDSLQESSEALAQRGAVGSQYVRKNMRWSNTNKSLTRLYNWLLGEEAMPEFVSIQ